MTADGTEDGYVGDTQRLADLGRRLLAGRSGPVALLVAAALVARYTEIAGLAAVLVVLAGSRVAETSGSRAGVAVVVVAGSLFVTLRTAQGRLVGAEIALTFLSVSLWAFVAWAAGAASAERRRLDADLDQHIAELQHRAMHDPLTGLANRDLLLDRLEHAMQRSHRYGTRVAVLLLDLDNFKLINDSMGHAAGDRLLVCAADRIASQLRSTDTAARFGGDEFAVVCEDLGDGDEWLRIADRILAALRAPVAFDGREVSIAASIGVAVPETTVQPPQRILEDADKAMYRAKRHGGSRVAVFGEGRPRPAIIQPLT